MAEVWCYVWIFDGLPHVDASGRNQFADEDIGLRSKVFNGGTGIGTEAKTTLRMNDDACALLTTLATVNTDVVQGDDVEAHVE